MNNLYGGVKKKGGGHYEEKEKKKKKKKKKKKNELNQQKPLDVTVSSLSLRNGYSVTKSKYFFFFFFFFFEDFRQFPFKWYINVSKKKEK